MKRIIICCDGTWQNSDGGVLEDPTNITRITRALKSESSDGIAQIVYYQAGVGTGGAIDKIIGGGTGDGLSENVREAYGFLAHNFHPSDTIHLFGFSRGAYTARSICGLICRLGILTKRGMDRFYQIYKDYMAGRLREPGYVEALQAEDGGALVTPDVNVTTIGCFDTVGALGIPTLPVPGLGHALSGVVNAKKYSFHATDLSPRVLHAFHALALDEMRAPFTPSLWYKLANNNNTELRQCWFPGVHTNIGGGYPDQEISDMTLAWMIERTKQYLDWDPTYLQHIMRNGGDYRKEWAAGKIYDSRMGLMKLAGKEVRTPGEYHTDEAADTGEMVHVSARVRKIVMDGEWNGGALAGWTWDSDRELWVNSAKPEVTLKEDVLGDTEMELAGKDVVEKVLGWAFPDHCHDMTTPEDTGKHPIHTNCSVHTNGIHTTNGH
ncbi:hypothetical protein BDD12DRAFT_727926 [Trichophaea hybrida]|nr:hypothetical protein BDD12DRAFT_727926 [Trichophaea hybrida]